MIKHHQVFRYFPCWEGIVREGFACDFLGVMTRVKYFSPLSSPDCARIRFVQSSYPPFDEEYFEWIDLLEAVIGSTDCFTMVELGAGWGRWLCRAAVALRQYSGVLPYRLLGVEAEPTHFRWMFEHLMDNRVNIARCRFIEAAVSDKDGVCQFFIGDADEWYGQRIALPREKEKPTREVRAVSLRALLNDLGAVDLIDLDIQGSELSVLSAAIKQIDAKVKRVHIGTHSAEVERGLRKLFTKRGWCNRYDFPAGTKALTEYGSISFQDGVQSWVNPSKLGG